MGKTGSRTRFINVDLEVRSKQDLAPLASAFEPRAFALSCMPIEDRYLASFELLRDPTDPDAGIRSFLRLVAKLPPRARRLWTAASRRDFSIGVQAGSATSSFELALTPAVLRLAADVGAHVSFVVYVAGGMADDTHKPRSRRPG